MSTLQARVEDYTGTIADTTSLTDHLTAGAKMIVNHIPEYKLERYSADLTDSGSGVTISGHRFVNVHKSGYRARLIESADKARGALSGSYYIAATTDPVYYVENSKCYVLPSGGTVRAVAYPTVAYGDSSISNFPTEWEHGVVLYTVIQQLLSKINTSITSLDALTLDSVSAPSAPADASYSYTDATLGTYTSTSISAFGTAPTYTKPTTTASFTNLNTYIGTQEDGAKASAETQQQSVILDLYGKDLYNELNEFNAQLEEYKGVIAKNIRQAELDQERLMLTANKTTDLSIQNKVQTLQADISLYQSKLSKFSGQINLYGVQVNQAVQKLGAYVQRTSSAINSYTGLIQQCQVELDRILKAI